MLHAAHTPLRHPVGMRAVHVQFPLIPSPPVAENHLGPFAWPWRVAHLLLHHHVGMHAIRGQFLRMSSISAVSFSSLLDPYVPDVLGPGDGKI